MKRRAGFLITVSMDIIAISLGFILVFWVRESAWITAQLGALSPIFETTSVYLVAVISFLFLAFNESLYGLRKTPKIKEMTSLAKMHGKWIIVLMAVAYLWKYDFSRFMLLVYVPLCLVLTICGRLVARAFYNYLLSKRIGVVNVVIVGRGKKAREIEKEIERYYGSSMKLLATIIPLQTESGLVIPHNHLMEIVTPHDYVQVYIVEPQLSHESILHTMAQCSLPQVEFKVVADLFTLATGSFNVTNIDEIPTLEIGKSQPSLFYRITKRIIDIIGSIVLIIISSPFWILTALLIKIETPGSVIISQKRVGFKGKEFTLWKFRTMYKTSALYEAPPHDGADKRITKVGRFLRKTSLDELPQLINVLFGSMSLVGPRPEMPFIVETYTAWQKKRLEAKPGLTGLWQILGRKDIPLTENLHYDFYYINNQSLILDTVILLRTVPVVLFGKGAY